MKSLKMKTPLWTLAGMALLAACSSQAPSTKLDASSRVASATSSTVTSTVAPTVWSAPDTDLAMVSKAQNAPSAPTNTPLCGSVSKEINRIGAKIYPDSLATQASCTRSACFNPLTGSFIANTGARSVCR